MPVGKWKFGEESLGLCLAQRRAEPAPWLLAVAPPEKNPKLGFYTKVTFRLSKNPL